MASQTETRCSPACLALARSAGARGQRPPTTEGWVARESAGEGALETDDG
jgi:hypothetical protein